MSFFMTLVLRDNVNALLQEISIFFSGKVSIRHTGDYPPTTGGNVAGSVQFEICPLARSAHRARLYFPPTSQVDRLPVESARFGPSVNRWIVRKRFQMLHATNYCCHLAASRLCGK